MPSRPISACLAPAALAVSVSLASCAPIDDPAGLPASTDLTAAHDDQAVGFPAGTICNDTGSPRTPPATVGHVVVLLMENRRLAAVVGNSQAPYIDSLARQCGTATRFLDNLFGATNQQSLPHYLALVSGSNCNTGLDHDGTGCVVDDASPSHHRLNTRTVFSQVGSWRAYQEDMPAACDASDGATYAVRHDPPPYFTSIPSATCNADDQPIAAVNCPTRVATVCSTPSNAFTRDLDNDTLPQLAFVTPDLDNDMHNGTTAQGDNWLHTYLPRVFASPAYRRGDVAIYVLWDEAAPGQAQPALFISPYIQPTRSTATMNLFAALRSIEDQLGIATHLGCASGTVPGTGGPCPAGSTADLRAIYHF